MVITVNKLKLEATITRQNGTAFTLSADTRQALEDMIAMWQLPLEHWNGSFYSAARLAQSSEATTSIDLNQRESA